MARNESQLIDNGKTGSTASGRLRTAAGGPMLALEPRILLDAAIGDAVAKVADGVVHHTDPAAHSSTQSASKDILLALAPMGRDQVGRDQVGREQTGRDQLGREQTGREQTRREVIFVDAGAKNIKELLGKATPQRQVVVLNPNRDGVQQITRVLARMKNVDAIHIFSHGEGGKIQLGNGELSLANIQKYQKQLKQWAAHMNQTADILIYGCNVAEGQRGADFVRMLAQLTQADVAASTDLTGAENLGGDWDLEDTVGHIETDVALSVHGREQYKETLAVTRPADTNGALGTNLNFNGIKDHVVIADQGKVLTNTSTYTVEAWVKLNSLGKYQGIVSSAWDNTNKNGAPFDLLITNSNKVLFQYHNRSTAASDWTKLLSSTTIATDSWYHIAATRDAAAGTMKLYVTPDGGATSVTTATGTNTFAPALTANKPIYIGARAPTGTATQFLDGQIDEVRIWNTARTQAEITATTNFELANGTGSVSGQVTRTTATATATTGETFANLTGYWRLDQANALDRTSAVDSSLNANAQNATLTNFAFNGSTSDWSNSAAIIGGMTTGQAINDNAITNPFSTVTFADAQGDNFALTVTLDSAAKGIFTQASLTASGFTDNGSGVYSHASTSAALAQSAIQSLVFQPTQNHVAVGATDTTTFTITTDDGKVSGTSTDATTTVIATSVNDAPTLSGTTVPGAITDVQTSTVFSGIAVADVDVNTSVSVTIAQTLSNGAADTAFANGTFTILGIGGYNFVQNAGTGTYTLSGATQAQAQASLQAMVFTPTAGQAAPGATVATTFKLDVSDGIVSAGQDATTVLTVSNPNAPANAPATPNSDNTTTGISSSALDLTAGGIFDVHSVATTVSINNTSNASVVSITDTPILDTVRQSFANSAANDQPANVLNNTSTADESTTAGEPFDMNLSDVNLFDVNQFDVNTLPASSAGNEQQTPAQKHTAAQQMTQQRIVQQETVQQKTAQQPVRRSIDQQTTVQKAAQAARLPASGKAPLPGSASLAGLGAAIDNLNLDADLRDQITLISPDRFQLLFSENKTTKGNTTYAATHPDGKPLPDYIRIDAQNGKISIQRALAPAGLSDVALKISRIIRNGGVEDVKSASVRINLDRESKGDPDGNKSA